MRIRQSKGRLVADLTGPEVGLLAQFLAELGQLVEEPDQGDPLVQRLFPDGYRDDPDAVADFRSLTQLSLQRERRERYAECAGELPEGGGRIALTPDAAQRWLMVLNDMRLALGTRLGVTPEGFDPANHVDGDENAQLAYHWLTMMQDRLLTRVAG